jgi:hypothetical protein
MRQALFVPEGGVILVPNSSPKQIPAAKVDASGAAQILNSDDIRSIAGEAV